MSSVSCWRVPGLQLQRVIQTEGRTGISVLEAVHAE